MGGAKVNVPLQLPVRHMAFVGELPPVCHMYCGLVRELIESVIAIRVGSIGMRKLEA